MFSALGSSIVGFRWKWLSSRESPMLLDSRDTRRYFLIGLGVRVLDGVRGFHEWCPSIDDSNRSTYETIWACDISEYSSEYSLLSEYSQIFKNIHNCLIFTTI